MVKKQTLRSTKRSSSTGVLLDVNPRLPAVSESRQDLLEELEMLRTVNAELKRQVQDKDDEKAMQEKVNDTGRRKLVKKLSNLGKYLDLTGPLRKESRSSTDSCTHGDISPSDMSPRSKFLIRQITISSASSPVHSTFLHSPESVFQSISLYGTQEALSETTTKSETQVDGKNSSDNDENADKSVASHNPPNEGHLRVSTTSVENGRKPDLSVIPSHKPCHEKGISTLPHDVVLSHSPVARKQKSLSGSWPQSPLLNQDPVSELLGKDTKASSRWLNENGLSPSLKDLRQHPHWEKKKPKFLDEALAYDSSCEMIHCLPDQDIHENDSTTTSDEEDFLLERHKDGHEDGQDAGDKDRPPDPDYVKPPGTLETLQAVADRLMTSSSIRRINFDISPTQIRQTPDRMYKVVFVGNSNVGKTTLVNRLCMGEFRSFSATIGVDFRVKLVSVDNQLVSLQLWDTAGQEKYRKFGLTSQYYRKADGVILVYDVTSKESFMDIREWISCVERATGEDASMSVMVLGNKVDLVQPKDRSTLESNGKCVPLHSGESLAKQMEAQYFEVSAKTGYNIDEACATFVRTLFDRENKLMDAAKAPLRDSTKQSRPTSVIVLGDNPEYQETAKKCRC
jgi:Ras and EF-hand domain-containing protein